MRNFHELKSINKKKSRLCWRKQKSRLVDKIEKKKVSSNCWWRLQCSWKMVAISELEYSFPRLKCHFNIRSKTINRGLIMLCWFDTIIAPILNIVSFSSFIMSDDGMRISAFSFLPVDAKRVERIRDLQVSKYCLWILLPLIYYYPVFSHLCNYFEFILEIGFIRVYPQNCSIPD